MYVLQGYLHSSRACVRSVGVEEFLDDKLAPHDTLQEREELFSDSSPILAGDG